MAATDRLTLNGPDLVQKIATIPARKGEVQRKFISFAAKFCHFFVSADIYPIYDDAAREVLKLHLGATITVDEEHPYAAFCRNFAHLKNEAKLDGPNRTLDRYLWITGMFMKWLRLRKKVNQPMNVELRELFERRDGEAIRELKILLPHSLKERLLDLRNS